MKVHAVLLVSILSTLPAVSGVVTGTRINIILTPPQEAFVNSHFDYVMTPGLADSIRETYRDVHLLLYRSIQGTWPGFHQFNWQHIDSHENMFCHSDSVGTPDNRIWTHWDSYLMDGGDLVPSDQPDSLDHWINYYAHTASEQVYDHDYDGLFIDSAGHRLSSYAVGGNFPWDYSDETWRDDRYAALAFIKAHLPDRMVIFNGLHNGNGAEYSLELTDGGMWEVFAFREDTGEYLGMNAWGGTLMLFNAHKDSSLLALIVKVPGLIAKSRIRMFATASYFLVASPQVMFAMNDQHDEAAIQYFPEYDIEPGEPLGDYEVLENNLVTREFTRGRVVVNPTEDTLSYLPEEPAWLVHAEFGGYVSADGTVDGRLSCEEVSGLQYLPPVSALILLDSDYYPHWQAPVTDLQIQPLDGDVVLSWSPAPDAAAYVVYASTEPYSGFVQLGSTQQTQYVVSTR